MLIYHKNSSPLLLLLVLLSFLFSPAILFSQETVSFEEGLAVPMSHNYSRTAVHTDKIEWQLIHDEFEPPEENKIFDISVEGDTLRWQKIKVNEEGRFASRDLRSGYLYLTFTSDVEQTMWLQADGHNMAYVNGIPRAGDIYAYGFVYLPIKVKEGKNEILLRSARWGGIRASIESVNEEVGFMEGDMTLPNIISGEDNLLWGAVRIINSTDHFVNGMEIKSRLNGNEINTPVSEIAPLTIRKVPFQFDPANISLESGQVEVELKLMRNGNTIADKNIQVEVIEPDKHYSRTFVSDIDGGVQYYSVAPHKADTSTNAALFLSVHGAEVEAISQARAYQPKDWGTLVAPTNRRPRGFNWEDWGRMDALEVLELAKEQYKPDPKKIYLTGHSMGGHGTWYLGATYPEYWAAIAPAAAYPSLRAYGSHDGTVPDQDNLTSVEEMLLRSSNPGDVMSLIPNYKSHGVYVLHGDADRVVSVEHARTMREELGKFHPDFAYYEYPGGSHWYGDESVDWPPMFNFFQNRQIPSSDEIDEIQFITANPGISHKHYWATIDQQEKPLELSKFTLSRNTDENKISGTTKNIARLSLDLSLFDPEQIVNIELDKSKPVDLEVKDENRVALVKADDEWHVAEKLSPKEKGPHRYGAFKEGFKNQMVFVYGTSGSDEENEAIYNKTRYDAETWYYRGNGTVDLIPDRNFNPEDYKDRGIVLYGNRDTNAAWNALLSSSPIQISRDNVNIGDQQFKGDDIGAYFIYPRPDSDLASVVVISGTGTKGMKAATANQYFAGGSGFPDFMIFQSSMLLDGGDSILSTGFFDNSWKLDPTNTVTKDF